MVSKLRHVQLGLDRRSGGGAQLPRRRRPLSSAEPNLLNTIAILRLRSRPAHSQLMGLVARDRRLLANAVEGRADHIACHRCRLRFLITDA